jgi:heterogeneous nuclear ribonucleoprotein U-like protein 1
MLPEVGDIFNEVLYTELPEAESRLLVEQYNREGRDAGYGQSQKRHRNDNRDGRDRSSFRGGYRPRGIIGLWCSLSHPVGVIFHNDFKEVI